LDASLKYIEINWRPEKTNDKSQSVLCGFDELTGRCSLFFLFLFLFFAGTTAMQVIDNETGPRPAFPS
jgi:hypothetical protein